MAFDKNLLKTPDSDEWWVARLSKALAQRRPRIEELQAWLDGKPPAPWQLDTKAQDGYERLLSVASLNLAELIVSSTLYRTQVETVRAGTNPTDEQTEAMNAALLETDANAHFRQAIEWMLSLSVAYLLVREDESADGESVGRLSAEHPAEMIAEADPVDPAKNVAALKVYRDDTHDRDVLVLYRDGYMRVAYKLGTSTIFREKISLRGFEWAKESDKDEPPGTLKLSQPGVPVYTLQNRFGKGEFEKHIPHMQRINHIILQQMIITAMQAFKQRAIKGVPNADPETGEAIDYSNIFTSDPGSLWMLPESAEIWESGTGDINQLITSITKDVERLAIAAQAPLYALSSDAAQQSAASSELMREGQIFKAEDLQKRLTPRFAAAVSHMLRFSGQDTLADRRQMRVVWAPARRSSLLERAQAGQLAIASGLPVQTVAELFFEFSPAQIQQMEAYRASNALLDAGSSQSLLAGLNLDTTTTE